jgi:hypothetical protein
MRSAKVIAYNGVANAVADAEGRISIRRVQSSNQEAVMMMVMTSLLG